MFAGEAVVPLVGRERELSRVEGEIARVCGELNVLHAELVGLVGEALRLGAAEGEISLDQAAVIARRTRNR